MSLPVQIWDLASLLQRDIERMLAEQDITFVEFRVLAICEESGGCTATDIGAAAPIEASSISRVVQRLYQKGLVSRRRSRNDRRIVRLRATAEGEALMGVIERRLQEFMEDMAERAGGERLDMLAVSTAVVLEALWPSSTDE